MLKRIFIIVLGLLLVIAIGLAMYFFIFKKDAPTLTGTTTNPFGDTGDNTFSPPSTLEVGEKLANAGEEVAPRLIRISKEPVANGAVAFPSKVISSAENVGMTTATTTQVSTPDTEVRYIERASGNVYSYFTKSRTLTRLSNRTLPGVVEAAWLADGSQAFVRFLTQNEGGEEEVTTYTLPADGNGGYILEKNLKEVAVLGTTSVFSLLSSTSGSIGTLAKVDGTQNKTLFSSPLSSLHVFPTRTGYIAATDPTAETNGYAFSIASATGAFSRILGPFVGLSILPSPSGTSILYSALERGTPVLSVIDVKTRARTQLPLSSLADKCVWTKDELTVYCAVPTNLSGNLPDSWYQGITSFSDRLWKISLKDRLATLIIDPAAVGKTPIDMTNLSLDPTGSVLIFTNKKDLSLWVYSF